MLKGGIIPAYPKPAIHQDLSDSPNMYLAMKAFRDKETAEVFSVFSATLKWFLHSLESHVSVAVVQCKCSPEPGAHRGVRQGQEDECPAANWSDLTRDNVSSSTGESLVRNCEPKASIRADLC